MSDEEVHLITVTIDKPALSAELSEGCLAPEEILAAGEISRPALRRRFKVIRAVTRIVLARCLGTAPADICLDRTSRGKPHLAGNTRLHFNLSHSGDLLVFALTPNSEIGVDVERIRPLPHAPQLASRFFLPEEAAAIESLPALNRELSFFSIWTQKEAYLKAIGLGIEGGLKSFRVATASGQPARVEWTAAGDAARWQMHRWRPAPGYVAAVAYRDLPRKLNCEPMAHASLLLKAFDSRCLSPALVTTA